MIDDDPTLKFKYEGLRKWADELLDKQVKAEVEISRLKREVEMLSGENPDYRQFLRQQADQAKRDIAHAKGQLERVEALYRSRETEIEARIHESLEKARSHEDEAARVRMILALTGDSDGADGGGNRTIRQAQAPSCDRGILSSWCRRLFRGVMAVLSGNACTSRSS